jgi:hypothetical protein
MKELSLSFFKSDDILMKSSTCISIGYHPSQGKHSTDDFILRRIREDK